MKKITKIPIKIYNRFILRKKFITQDFIDQKKLLKNQNVENIFDLGTNLGQTTTKYIKLFPNAKITSFEPFPDCFNAFKTKFKNKKNIHLHNYAVSNTNGVNNLNVNFCHYTNSLLKTEEDPNKKIYKDEKNNLKNISTIEVRTITLDTFCKNKAIEHIDILKMDIQGGELDALIGAKELLTNQKISIIYSEIEFVEIYKNQPLFHDICKFLHDHKYHLYNIYNSCHKKKNGINTQIISGDAIFVNQKIRENIIFKI